MCVCICVCCRYLFGNQLTSSIPSQIGRLVALQYLSVASVCCRISIALMRIAPRHLYNNRLTSSIPSQIGKLAALQHLFETCLHCCVSLGNDVQLAQVAEQQSIELIYSVTNRPTSCAAEPVRFENLQL